MSNLGSNLDAGAGLSLKSKLPANTPGQPSVISRAISLSTYFLSGVISINLSQFLGTPLKFVNEDWYNAWIAFTKQSFGILTMGLTQVFAPTTVIVSGNASVRGQLKQSADGNLQLNFPERMILIANHQIYTDWLYLWWIAYCNGVHGRLYIILKESLKRIPIIGWGMQLSQFIFLKRDWEQDKPQLSQALQRLNKVREPMWLLLFPEGTNLAPSTRIKSSQWAAKNKIKDMQHVLLPRSTGLQFCLEELKDSVDYLYDCTIAYEGVSRGEYAQDIFTLKAGYIQGKPPKSVSMYWRRFAIKDIPKDNENGFRLWLNARWREKDLLIESYLRFGRFPADSASSVNDRGMLLKGCGRLNVQIKPNHWYEFLQIFAPMGVLAMVLYVFYGALPQKVWDSINREALSASTNNFKTVQGATRGVSGSFNANALFDESRQTDTVKNLGMSLAELLQSPEAHAMINRAGLVQRWLDDPQKFILDNLEQLEDAKPKRSFLRDLEAESRKRRGSTPYQGTFWKDLEALEASRVKIGLSEPPKKVDASVTRRKAPKLGPPKLERMEKSKSQSQSFWDDLRNEENNRHGSVTTISSNYRQMSPSKPTSVKSLPAKLSSRPKKLATNKSSLKSVATTQASTCLGVQAFKAGTKHSK